MNRLIPFLTRTLLAVFLGALMPLRAQLDPRLTTTPTDFLDLYQQSVTTKIKPEIATVFDFSGSMRYLMYHKLYPNKDISDSDSEQTMNFALYSSPATRTYTVRASANGSPTGCYDVFTIKVGSTGSASNAVTNTSYGITTITCTSMATVGTALTFQAALTKGSNTRIDWVVKDNNGIAVAVGQSSQSLTVSQSFVWVVPPAVTNIGTGSLVVSPVTADLCATCTMKCTLSMGLPVKPDGTLVTASDASLATSSSSGLYGLSAGASDIRNWVRAASHMRYQYSDNGTLRTVDIPIPWKITTSASTGNPLSSLTIADPVSGNTMEFETGYTFNHGAYVLPGGSGTVTTTSLNYATFKSAYIAWLFQGRFLDGTYAGKYLVYDAANPSLAGGQTSLAWGQGYGTFLSGDTIKVPSYDLKGAYQGETSVEASSMVVPARSRCQAVKQAAISTWIKYQNQVVWAYRFLDVGVEANNGSASTIDNNSKTYQNVTAGVPTSPQNGCDSAWCLLNNTTSSPNNSINGMKRLAALFPNNGTPLTYAMARTLAQFSDPNSVFNAFETGSNPPPQCLNHFLILFTDGVDNNGTGTNNGNNTTPYLGTVTTGDAVTGNLAVIASPSKVDCLASWWNIFSYAGIAAHLADSSLKDVNGNAAYMSTNPTIPSGAQAPEKYLPFAIRKRNNVSFQYDHRIQTFTVGVSLAGSYTDPTSPKRSLFIAAAVGDPAVKSWNLDKCTPFQLKNEDHPEYGRVDGSICFFDASDPTALLKSLDSAFQVATAIANTNATTNPNLPFVGGSLGQEIYLGSFLPPKEGGVIWDGDLMMFSTRYLNGTPQIVDNTGTPLTTLNASKAQWSASMALSGTLWSSRNLYTRIPGSASTPEPGLTKYSDQDTDFAKISPYLLTGIGEAPSPTDAQKKSALQWAAGGNTNGDLDATGRPKTNRSSIMGDIINSTPAALEYNFSQVSGKLTGFKNISAVPGANRFRLIIVGDNQGWVHGFGEVSATTTVMGSDGVTPVKDSNGNLITVATGKVDELWAFMPSDFLGYLDFLQVPKNPHRFMADGAPTIYFLDLPNPPAYPNGNGVFDLGNDERAVAVFGLHKGGRSYYALDISDPFKPSLRWSLVPDEADSLASKTLVDGTSAIASNLRSDNVTGIVKRMGFSTCVPALGRLVFNDKVKDVIFLGGGYSVSQVDKNFPVYPNPPAGQNTPLGRSVLALDAWTGQILAAADLASVSSSAGPVGTGLIPFQFFQYSGLVQRAYFTDLYGGLWSWDQNTFSTTAPYVGFRMDSSDLSTWASDGTTSLSATSKIRQVYQDTSGSQNAIYTALPAPFRLSYFPGMPHDTNSATPAVVGVVMVSGDRNNPLDNPIGYPMGVPSNFRLTTVFDRQDSHLWSSNLTTKGSSNVITDNNLADFSASPASSLPKYTNNPDPSSSTNDPIIPGRPTYYLAPTDASGSPNTSQTKFGYFIKLPSGTANPAPPPDNFYAKGITDPYVVSNVAFFSFFQPKEVDPCSGGSGYTYTNKICDVVNPGLSMDKSACTTGNALPFSYWVNIPSNFTLFGTQGTFQAGTVLNPNAAAGESTTQVNFATLQTSSADAFPKVHVWRVVK